MPPTPPALATPPTIRRRRRTPAHYYESIDYVDAANVVQRRRNDSAPNFDASLNQQTDADAARRRASASGASGSSSSSTTTRYALTLFVGALTGVTAWAIEGSTGAVISMQAALMNAYYSEAPGTTTALFAATATVLGCVAGWFAVYYAPLASGGGVTQVMATLNGANIPGLLSGRTLSAKIAGTACGVGSALAIGPEGPMVHVGAGIASVCTLYWPRKKLCSDLVGNGGNERGRGGESASDDDEDEDETSSSSSSSEEETDSDVEGLASPMILRDGRREAGARRHRHRNGRRRRRRRRHRDAGAGRAGLIARILFGAAPKLDDDVLLDLASQSTQRDFISAGAAAGLAAAFGAPIGGVLFSFEEASTFWSQRTMWRCLMCAAMASFVLALLDLRGNPGMVFITGDTLRATTPRDYFHQLPFFVIVAAIAGLTGAMFNQIQAFMSRFRPSASNKLARMIECAFVVLATVGIRFAASAYAGQCMTPPDAWAKDDFGVRFNCAEGEINDIATVFFIYPGKSIGWMFGMAEHVWGEAYGFTPQGLAIAAGCYLLMMALAFGIAVPGGLFMPSLFLGACTGGCAGLVLKNALPEAWDIQPGLYSLIGATSALGGVFRSSVSLVVIMVESTNGQAFVFAIIVAVVVSNAVGNYLAHGIYHSELQRSATVAYLPKEPSKTLAEKTAADVMAVPPAYLPEIASRDVVTSLLEHTTHNGFPVVDNRGKLSGLILRSQLEVLLAAPRGDAAPGADARTQARLDLDMRVSHIRRAATEDAISTSLAPASRGAMVTPGVAQRLLDETVDAIEVDRVMMRQSDAQTTPTNHRRSAVDDVLSPSPLSSSAADVIDIATYMHSAPLSVHLDFPARRAHDVFLSQALRHLVVVDGDYAVQGVITRKDLIGC